MRINTPSCCSDAALKSKVWKCVCSGLLSSLSSGNCTNVKQGIHRGSSVCSVKPSQGKGNLKIATWLWIWPSHPPKFLQKPSLVVSNRTTLQDEQSPACSPFTWPDRHFHTTYIWRVTLISTLFQVRGEPLTKEQQCYEGSSGRGLLSVKSSVRWGSWGMESSCDTLQGMRWPTIWPVWLVPPLKGRLAAVRGCRRAEGQDWHTLHSCSSQTHAHANGRLTNQTQWIQFEHRWGPAVCLT